MLNRMIEQTTDKLKEVELYEFVEFLRTYPYITESERIGDKCYIYKDINANKTIACWQCTAKQHYWVQEEHFNEKEGIL